MSIIWDAPLPPDRSTGSGSPAADMNLVKDAIVEVRTEVDNLPTGGGGGGGWVSDVVTVTANAEALKSTLVKVDATTGAVTITLDDLATEGNEIAVMKIDTSANAVTVVAPGAQTINGQVSATINEQYAGMNVVKDDASNWLIRSVM